MEKTIVTEEDLTSPPPQVEEQEVSVERAEGAVQPQETAAGEDRAPSESPPVEAAENGLSALRTEVEALREALASRAEAEQVAALRALVADVQGAASEGLQAGQQQREALRAESRAAVDGLQERLTGTERSLGEVMALLRPRTRRETFDPGTVPPDVLSGAYEQTATDVYAHMRQILGPAAAEQQVRAIMEGVRRITAGMEFFRATDAGQIVAPGLAGALSRRLISPHQVHITFNEFLRNLLETVPGYRPPPLRELVDTGTRAYTVNTATQLLEHNETIRADLKDNAARLERLERLIGDEARARGDALASLESRLTVALETATGNLGTQLAGLKTTLASLEVATAPSEQAEEATARQTLPVTKNGTIGVGGARYYVARKLAGEEVQVEVGEEEVRIYYEGELIKTHERKK